MTVFSRAVRAVSAALAGTLLAGFAGLLHAQDSVAPPPVSSPQGLATSVVPGDYVIGPGDVLQVFVWRNPELTATVPVRPDGKISTPLVEDMVAVGKNPSMLARDIETVIATYVKQPQVNVIVTQAQSAFSQIKVIGQVREPRALAYREGMKVLDAVLETGGLAEFAAGNRAKVLREENGRQVEIRVRLGRMFDGDMRDNIALKPGDVLLIPQSRF